MFNLHNILSALRKGFSNILFPPVCLCCGQHVLGDKNLICDFCLHKRFEDANPQNEATARQIILPEGIKAQHALWNFDKGGMLQQLMHALKYERLTSVGTQLGEVLGRRMKKHDGVQKILQNKEALLLPVPLHYLKYRKRGFNQAFYIARGVENKWHIPICSIDAVVRKKYTLSQTGFNLEKRIKNMQNAFRVRKFDELAGKVIIIIDDVFTTGSTTFELGRTLKKSGVTSMMIWTLAQA